MRIVLTLFILTVITAGCAVNQTSTYNRRGYKVEHDAREEVLHNMTTSPVKLYDGKRFAKAGVIDFVVIEGNSNFTNGKKSVSFTIHQYVEVGKAFYFDITGPDCCVKKVDEQNFNFRVAGSLQFFRLSFDPETGAPSMRTMSGSTDMVTVRYAIKKLW